MGYRFIAPVGEPVLGREVPMAADIKAEKPPKSPAPGFWLQKSWASVIVIALIAIAAGAIGSFALRVKPKPAANPAAIQDCQQGRDLWRQRTPETLVKAIDQFKTAAAIDPAYAPTYSGLADAYLVLPFLSSVSREEAYPKAREAAARAVALDPSLAEAHTSVADVKLYVDWDFSGAEREFHRALELDPKYATAHQWHAEYLSLMGRHDEAIEEIQRAQQLEPLSVVMYHQAGQIYQNARQYDKAIGQYNRALQINPAFSPSCEGLAIALRRKGLYRESLEALRRFYERNASFYSTGGALQVSIGKQMHALETGGPRGYWLYILNTMLHDVDPERLSYLAAVRYAQVDDADHAMLWLEKASQLRVPDVLNLKVDPDLDPVRSDPRFQALVRRIGLP